MALSKIIVEKIKEKTSDRLQYQQELIQLMAKIEEGRQPKRQIDSLMDKIS